MYPNTWVDNSADIWKWMFMFSATFYIYTKSPKLSILGFCLKNYYYQNLTPTATYVLMNDHLITIVLVTFHNAEDWTTPDCQRCVVIPQCKQQICNMGCCRDSDGIWGLFPQCILVPSGPPVDDAHMWPCSWLKTHILPFVHGPVLCLCPIVDALVGVSGVPTSLNLS